MNLNELKKLIATGDLDAVRIAIDENPDLVHISDPADDQWEEMTALHSAVRYGNLAIVKLLVERGAEVYSNSLTSYPPIFIADRNQHFKDRPDAQHIVDYFLNEIPSRANGTNGLGVSIHLAARAGWTDLVRKHIQRDPLAVHQRGLLGDTPLHWSCHNGYVQIVNMLLDAGADIEADELNCYGGKPLHWASEHKPEVVKVLLERGANVNAINNRQGSEYFGITPLLMNCLMKDDCAAVTELLIAAGAATDVTFQGKSLLEIAQDKGNEKIHAFLQSK